MKSTCNGAGWASLDLDASRTSPPSFPWPRARSLLLMSTQRQNVHPHSSCGKREGGLKRGRPRTDLYRGRGRVPWLGNICLSALPAKAGVRASVGAGCPWRGPRRFLIRLTVFRGPAAVPSGSEFTGVLTNSLGTCLGLLSIPREKFGHFYQTGGLTPHRGRDVLNDTRPVSSAQCVASREKFYPASPD